jgi:hypothetical protein
MRLDPTLRRFGVPALSYVFARNFDSVISAHQSLESRTDKQYEVMHKDIVQKTADIIGLIRSLDIYALFLN